jgi:hypothetical protein
MEATHMTAREQMTSRIAGMSTEQILEAVVLIGGSDDLDKAVVRVNLLAEYERREGGAAVDALMDAVGL